MPLAGGAASTVAHRKGCSMIPGPFAYHRAGSVAEALALLAEHGDEAKLLAGGQSLIPLMRFRLANPAVLIDINPIAALRGLRLRTAISSSGR